MAAKSGTETAAEAAKVLSLFGLEEKDRDKEPSWPRVSLALQRLNDDLEREKKLYDEFQAANPPQKADPKGTQSCVFFSA